MRTACQHCPIGTAAVMETFYFCTLLIMTHDIISDSTGSDSAVKTIPCYESYGSTGFKRLFLLGRRHSMLRQRVWLGEWGRTWWTLALPLALATHPSAVSKQHHWRGWFPDYLQKLCLLAAEMEENPGPVA